MPSSLKNARSRGAAAARRASELVFCAAMVGCTALRAPASPASPASPEPQQAATPISEPQRVVAPSEDTLAGWLTARLPKGGTLTTRSDGSIAVAHQVQDSETLRDVADAYVELTQIYLAEELARAIR